MNKFQKFTVSYFDGRHQMSLINIEDLNVMLSTSWEVKCYCGVMVDVKSLPVESMTQNQGC